MTSNLKINEQNEEIIKEFEEIRQQHEELRKQNEELRKQIKKLEEDSDSEWANDPTRLREFRAGIIRRDGNRCALTGIVDWDLEPCHIVPISRYSTDEYKLHLDSINAIQNGFLLCETLDRPFDTGEIEFDDDFICHSNSTRFKFLEGRKLCLSKIPNQSIQPVSYLLHIKKEFKEEQKKPPIIHCEKCWEVRKQIDLVYHQERMCSDYDNHYDIEEIRSIISQSHIETKSHKKNNRSSKKKRK